MPSEDGPFVPASYGGQGPPPVWFVYLFLCSDGDLYTGCTSDLQERQGGYELGEVPATAGRRPTRLVCYCAFTDKYVAFRFEKYLKSGSGRAFFGKHVLERLQPKRISA